MTALVAVETAVLVLLSVLVAGLLRSHATILQRLHDLDRRGSEPTPSPDEPPIRTLPGVPEPVAGGSAVGAARDLTGRAPDGGAVVVRVVNVAHNTVLAFLSSDCRTCQSFWATLADPQVVHLPRHTRLVVVTKDFTEESPSELARLRPPGLDIVASSQAWSDYHVPGSPYVVSVDGDTGRINGEGTGMSWEQVARLLAQATGDMGFLSSTRLRETKPESDADREARVDRELMEAGVLPGDPSLYPSAVPATRVDKRSAPSTDNGNGNGNGTDKGQEGA